jgi:hypothetical protein
LFVCYFLRIVADEEKRGGEEESDSSSSSYSDSNIDSSRSRKPKANLIKEARELFPW